MNNTYDTIRQKLQDARTVKSGTGAPVAKPGTPALDTTSLAFSSHKIGEIPMEKWTEVIQWFVKHSSKVEDFSYKGAEHPIERRTKTESLYTLSNLVTFAGVTAFRGFSFANYARKNDSTAQQIADMVKGLDIKVPKVGSERASGKYSPIGIIVSYADLFVAFYSHLVSTASPNLGNMMFNGVLYDKNTGGIVDMKYMFLGSLCAMYSPKEETELVKTVVAYCSEYHKFQNWYVDERRKAAKTQNKTGGASDDKIKEAKIRSISYYLLTVATYSPKCRKAWYENNWVKPERSDGSLLQNAELITALAKEFGLTEEQIRTPVGASK